MRIVHIQTMSLKFLTLYIFLKFSEIKIFENMESMYTWDHWISLNFLMVEFAKSNHSFWAKERELNSAH